LGTSAFTCVSMNFRPFVVSRASTGLAAAIPGRRAESTAAVRNEANRIEVLLLGPDAANVGPTPTSMQGTDLSQRHNGTGDACSQVACPHFGQPGRGRTRPDADQPRSAPSAATSGASIALVTNHRPTLQASAI